LPNGSPSDGAGADAEGEVESAVEVAELELPVAVAMVVMALEAGLDDEPPLLALELGWLETEIADGVLPLDLTPKPVSLLFNILEGRKSEALTYPILVKVEDCIDILQEDVA
jgi:hypothetical protein